MPSLQALEQPRSNQKVTLLKLRMSSKGGAPEPLIVTRTVENDVVSVTPKNWSREYPFATLPSVNVSPFDSLKVTSPPRNVPKFSEKPVTEHGRLTRMPFIAL